MWTINQLDILERIHQVSTRVEFQFNYLVNPAIVAASSSPVALNLSLLVGGGNSKVGLQSGNRLESVNWCTQCRSGPR